MEKNLINNVHMQHCFSIIEVYSMDMAMDNGLSLNEGACHGEGSSCSLGARMKSDPHETCNYGVASYSRVV